MVCIVMTKVVINFPNRALYAFVVVVLLVVSSWVVFAYSGGMGHTSDQIDEVDPTITDNRIKDGVSWGEVSGKPQLLLADIQVITGAISACRGASIAYCPAGYTVISGGHSFAGSCGCDETFRFTVDSYPVAGGWRAWIECGYTRAVAVCARFQ
jgi:hypothetical protein